MYDADRDEQVKLSNEQQQAPVPTLESLSPATAVSDSPDFTLSCVGTNLGPGTVIVFGNQDEPTTFVNAGEVTTIVKPLLFTPAVVPVCLRNGNYRTQPLEFTFTAM
jgi:hypothetical protein